MAQSENVLFLLNRSHQLVVHEQTCSFGKLEIAKASLSCIYRCLTYSLQAFGGPPPRPSTSGGRGCCLRPPSALWGAQHLRGLTEMRVVWLIIVLHKSTYLMLFIVICFTIFIAVFYIGFSCVYCFKQKKIFFLKNSTYQNPLNT